MIKISFMAGTGECLFLFVLILAANSFGALCRLLGRRISIKTGQAFQSIWGGSYGRKPDSQPCSKRRRMDHEVSGRIECRTDATVAHDDDSQIVATNSRPVHSNLRVDFASIRTTTPRKSGCGNPQGIAPFVLAKQASSFEPLLLRVLSLTLVYFCAK